MIITTTLTIPWICIARQNKWLKIKQNWIRNWIRAENTYPLFCCCCCCCCCFDRYLKCIYFFGYKFLRLGTNLHFAGITIARKKANRETFSRILFRFYFVIKCFICLHLIQKNICGT